MFDGHGPYGHMVSRKVRDSLPILLRSHWETKSEETEQSNHEHENGDFEGMRRFDDFMDEDGCESVEAEDNEKLVPEMHIPLKKSILKAFKLMDKELKFHPTIDCFCSGTTAVALIKQVLPFLKPAWLIMGCCVCLMLLHLIITRSIFSCFLKHLLCFQSNHYVNHCSTG